MKISYKKLWKLLIDRDMSRTELRLRAGISSVSLAKLGKNEGVTTNVLVKICSALDCNIGDIYVDNKLLLYIILYKRGGMFMLHSMRIR